MHKIDRFLNNITMYRLVLYGLAFMAAYAIFFGFFGVLHHSGVSYILLLVILTTVCGVTNFICGKLFNAPINIESWIITAFILFFVMYPVVSLADAATAAFAGAVAIASKFFITINRRHIFNPVAFGALAVGATAIFRGAMPPVEQFFDSGNVVWWVGTPAMFPLTLVVGLLIIRKIRKFEMFFAFIGGSILSTLVFTYVVEQQNFQHFINMLLQNTLSWPLVFFGAVMLTEPFTMPPHRRVQILFGFGVGLLFTARYSFGPLYSTPELALIIGNLFAYGVSMKRRAMLVLKEKHLISKDTYEFSFASETPLHFHAGQYLEWTLPERTSGHRVDNRGNRRYFTIASSPTEKEVKLGVKFYEPSSTFKSHLRELETGKIVAAGQLGGDFVLPKDASKKLVFIAGGIGVTPFRSMIKYLSDKKEKRDITLIYSVRTEDEIAYRDIFDEAEKEIGLKVVYLVGSFLNEEVISKDIPDWKERTFYMSGPNVMVENYKKLLLKMGLSRFSIRTDYFPGF
jgi:ferredoxin-NADP reductase/Na+-transporting NADH:ubiquinone oxidoreductase subunit NqrB